MTEKNILFATSTYQEISMKNKFDHDNNYQTTQNNRSFSFIKIHIAKYKMKNKTRTNFQKMKKKKAGLLKT